MKSRRSTQSRRRRDTRRSYRKNRKNTRARRGGFSPLNEAFQNTSLTNSLNNMQSTLVNINKGLDNVKNINPEFKSTTAKLMSDVNSNFKNLQNFNKNYLNNTKTLLNMKAIPTTSAPSAPSVPTQPPNNLSQFDKAVLDLQTRMDPSDPNYALEKANLYNKLA